MSATSALNSFFPSLVETETLTSLLVETLSNLTGLSIDHYVQVNFMGFYDLAKALGGITVDLCRDVNDTTAASGSRWGATSANTPRKACDGTAITTTSAPATAFATSCVPVSVSGSSTP